MQRLRRHVLVASDEDGMSTNAHSIFEMRRDYGSVEAEESELKQDAIDQFHDWFEEAAGKSVLDPNAMSLATVSPDGQPSLRTVLLKQYDERGFIFFTNLESRKAQEIAANPKVSLLFPWVAIDRQVIIYGVAERISVVETMKYFMTRPRGSQIAAWASVQSRRIPTRKFLEMEWERMKAKFERGEVPLPSFWGGFRVVPRQIEFWQGRPNRMHDRHLYAKQSDGSWSIERLAP